MEQEIKSLFFGNDCAHIIRFTRYNTEMKCKLLVPYCDKTDSKSFHQCYEEVCSKRKGINRFIKKRNKSKRKLCERKQTNER